MNPSKRNHSPSKKPGAASSFAKRHRQDTRGSTKEVAASQPWRPLGQRRLLATLERSIQHSIRWAVFEHNDESLWVRTRSAVEAALLNEWNNGNLRGSTADQAFFVRCDSTTMSEYDIANARLVVMVGVACVKPAEFIVLRVSQSTAG